MGRITAALLLGIAGSAVFMALLSAGMYLGMAAH